MRGCEGSIAKVSFSSHRASAGSEHSTTPVLSKEEAAGDGSPPDQEEVPAIWRTRVQRMSANGGLGSAVDPPAIALPGGYRAGERGGGASFWLGGGLLCSIVAVTYHALRSNVGQGGDCLGCDGSCGGDDGDGGGGSCGGGDSAVGGSGGGGGGDAACGEETGHTHSE